MSKEALDFGDEIKRLVATEEALNGSTPSAEMQNDGISMGKTSTIMALLAAGVIALAPASAQAEEGHHENGFHVVNPQLILEGQAGVDLNERHKLSLGVRHWQENSTTGITTPYVAFEQKSPDGEVGKAALGYSVDWFPNHHDALFFAIGAKLPLMHHQLALSLNFASYMGKGELGAHLHQDLELHVNDELGVGVQANQLGHAYEGIDIIGRELTAGPFVAFKPSEQSPITFEGGFNFGAYKEGEWVTGGGAEFKVKAEF